MDEIKTFEMFIVDELIDGVYCISMVTNPAIEEGFVLLSKDQKINIEISLEKIADEKRKILLGPILVPDKLILRDGYNITFSKVTIRKIAENFMIQNKKDNVNIQHKVNVNKVHLIESWIIEDDEKDKSKIYGFNLPIGTWMGAYKVKDEDLWLEYIESGVLKGFSLEGNFSSKEVKLECPCTTHTTTKSIEKEIFDIYLAINYTKEDLDKYYMWKLDTKKTPCPSCIGFANNIHTLREWLKIAHPATPNGTVIAGELCNFPYNPYGTYCEENCGCELVKVNETGWKKKHIIKPF